MMQSVADFSGVSFVSIESNEFREISESISEEEESKTTKFQLCQLMCRLSCELNHYLTVDEQVTNPGINSSGYFYLHWTISLDYLIGQLNNGRTGQFSFFSLAHLPIVVALRCSCSFRTSGRIFALFN